MTLDIPNAFVQTPLPDNNERIIMKIKGKLAEILTEQFPTIYSKYIQIENNTSTLYVVMRKALYGMMMSSLLFYRHFRKDLESIGFKINPYDICVANRNVDGHQQTVTWHVDDVKVSHISPHANDDFYKWCENKYGNEENGHVKVKRGKIHEYLAMKLDYTVPSKVIVDMRNYIKEIVELYAFNHNSNVTCPWYGMLFESNINKKKLTQRDTEIFHIFVMKCMFLAK